MRRTPQVQVNEGGSGSSAAGAPLGSYAGALLAVAEEVERLEERIRDAILEAASRGDCGLVGRIVRRWRELPVREVLDGSESADPSPRMPGTWT